MINKPWQRWTVLVFLLSLPLYFLGMAWSQAGPAAPIVNTDEAVAAELQVAAAVPEDWIKLLNWREMGPANMGGRITALAVYDADPTTYWVASASGGLLKTTNNGVTFKHQFDKEATVSIGDVCVAPSNRDIVWVGTGEANPRNSVSYGDGVYKSTDGGTTWTNMGLKKSFQIGKIAIHPQNPDIVYVGALGRLYGPHPERGLFKTTDGGQTWEKILYVDENTGVIDVVMNPNDPNTLLVAAWERRRDGFDSTFGANRVKNFDGYGPVVMWGEKGGIYKTTDGGKTFKKLSDGLPTCKTGRIGLDYYRKDPNIVFAIIDTEKVGMGTPPKQPAKGSAYLGFQGEDADPGVKVTSVVKDGPAAKAGLQVGDVIVMIDKKAVEKYAGFVKEINSRAAGDKAVLKVNRDGKPRDIEVVFGQKADDKGAAQKKTRPYAATLGQAANVQNQQGPDGFQTGGVFKSTDGGETWTRVNSLNPRPMYFSVIRVDPSDVDKIYVLGISQHKSVDGGKKFTANAGTGTHPDGHALWVDPRDGRHMVLGTDGGIYETYDRGAAWEHHNHHSMGQFYHVAVCNKRPYWVYGGMQDNSNWGGPSIGLKGGTGPVNEDWMLVGGADGFVCRVDPQDPDLIYYESQDGFMARRHLKTGETAQINPPNRAKHRFNWNTPFILSHHNPKIFYCAGDVVFRSFDRGKDLRPISPEITLTKNGSATALAESPRSADVLWVGTDDGGVWVTRNAGKDWQDVRPRLEAPEVNDFDGRWVATIEASRTVEGRAYVCLDGHRSDDDRPLLFVTEDFGATWKKINSNLPAFGSTRCLREDAENPDVLYCGTEFSVFASIDRGATWTRINNNLPTVAVHEIAVHPTAGEIVAATHGRSIWILDVAALRQMKPSVLKDKAFLFKPNTTVRWQFEPTRGKTTNRRFAGKNPPTGPQIYYSLTEAAEKVVFKVLDIEGKTLSQWNGTKTAGLHKTTWDMTRPGAGGKGGRGPAPAGDYRLMMSVDGQEFSQVLRLESDPNLPPGRRAALEELLPLPEDREIH